jgi:hypothetical protein
LEFVFVGNNDFDECPPVYSTGPCACFAIEDQEALFSYFSLELYSVFIQVAVQVSIAAVALAVDIVRIKSNHRMMPCAVEMPCVHLGQWLELLAGDADKASGDLSAVSLSDVLVEGLHCQLFEGDVVFSQVGLQVLRGHAF